MVLLTTSNVDTSFFKYVLFSNTRCIMVHTLFLDEELYGNSKLSLI